MHLCLGCTLTLLATGCGPSATLHLVQPSLPGWQRHLNLKAESACWTSNGKTDRVLVEFPPPGASTGRPLVILYLRLPVGVDDPVVAAKSEVCAKGFFIQTRGRYAGLSAVVGGSISVEGHSFSRTAPRKIKFDLKCEDGSLLVGTILARRDDWALHQFETKRRPVDVEMLAREPTPAPATQKGP